MDECSKSVNIFSTNAPPFASAPIAPTACERREACVHFTGDDETNLEHKPNLICARRSYGLYREKAMTVQSGHGGRKKESERERES